MCMYVFSLILHSASDEMNFIIIANLVKVSEDARDMGMKKNILLFERDVLKDYVFTCVCSNTFKFKLFKY